MLLICWSVLTILKFFYEAEVASKGWGELSMLFCEVVEQRTFTFLRIGLEFSLGMEALLWGLSKHELKWEDDAVLKRWVFIDSRAALFIKFKFNELNYNNHLRVLLKNASSMPASGPTLWSLSLFYRLLLTFCTSFLCIPSIAPCTSRKSSFLANVNALAFSF